MVGAGPAPLSGVRVLEVATQIAGPYCGKLLADAGADVVKVEPAGGDPLRSWGAADGADQADGADDQRGTLFRFLNTSKRSVIGDLDTPAVDDLAAAADLVIVDDGAGAERVRALHAAHPGAVVVSLTPFGLTGPWAEAGLPTTEFLLQAICGSTAWRGLATTPPLHAGGRPGEWVTGVYGAAVGLAALRGARRDERDGDARRRGDLVDVSMFECMVITMGGITAVGAAVLGTPPAPRSVELPSIEPTADGLVGFCTITAQQFQDFLILIERPDLLDDANLATMPGRLARRDEFLTAVHAWTTKHTTDEIIELASTLRIPVAPVGAPDTVTGIDQFVERGAFVPHPDKSFQQPRVPYRIGGFTGRPLGPAPELGADTGAVNWPRADRPPAAPAASERPLPLAGLRVLDFTAFWAGPAATVVLGSLGADVVKVEGVRRPDGLRFSAGKPPTEPSWWEWGIMFLATNANKRGVSLELSRPEAVAIARRLVAASDVVIENFSPRVMPNLGLDWADVHAANPAAVMTRMPAFGLDGPWRDRTGFAQTMEQASGMAWMTGEADGPPIIPRGVCDPIAGLHAVFATLVALEERDRTGTGTLVEATMVEAVLNVAAEAAVEYSAHGTVVRRAGNRGPVAVPQGVYRCADGDRWVAVAVTDDAQWAALRGLIGVADEVALRSAAGRRAAHDRIDAALGAWAAGRSRESAVAALRAAGVPTAPVTPSADLLTNPQLAARGFFEPVTHPVAGTHPLPGMPFAFTDRPAGWLRRPPPLFGEHTDAVLRELLGLSIDEIARLYDEGIVSRRPAGV